MGQRSISQLWQLDFARTITLGNSNVHPLSDEGLGIKGSLITILVLVFESEVGNISTFYRRSPN